LYGINFSRIHKHGHPWRQHHFDAACRARVYFNQIVTVFGLDDCLYWFNDGRRHIRVSLLNLTQLRLIPHERSKRGVWNASQNACQRQPNFQMRTYKKRRVRIYTSASDAFKLALAQRQAFPTRQEALPTLAFVTLCNLHRRFIRPSERGLCTVMVRVRGSCPVDSYGRAEGVRRQSAISWPGRTECSSKQLIFPFYDVKYIT
jgi:hypothetical protein